MVTPTPRAAGMALVMGCCLTVPADGLALLPNSCRRSWLHSHPQTPAGPSVARRITEAEAPARQGFQWCICCCCSPAAAKSRVSCGQGSVAAFPQTMNYSLQCSPRPSPSWHHHLRAPPNPHVLSTEVIFLPITASLFHCAPEMTLCCWWLSDSIIDNLQRATGSLQDERCHVNTSYIFLVICTKV